MYRPLQTPSNTEAIRDAAIGSPVWRLEASDHVPFLRTQRISIPF